MSSINSFNIMGPEDVERIIYDPQNQPDLLAAMRQGAIDSAKGEIADLPTAVDVIAGASHYRKGANGPGGTVHKIAKVGPGGLQSVFNVFGDGTITVINDQGVLSYARTAVAAIDAVKGTANNLPDSLLIVGSGRLAQEILKFRELIAGMQIGICGRSSVDGKICSIDTIKVIPWAEMPAAIKDHQAIITATRAQAAEAFLDLSLMSPGQTLVALGADKPGKAEIQNISCVNDNRLWEVFSDDPGGARKNGEMQNAPYSVVNHIGDLYCGNTPTVNGQTMLVDSTGAGWQDYVIAQFVVARR